MRCNGRQKTEIFHVCNMAGWVKVTNTNIVIFTSIFSRSMHLHLPQSNALEEEQNRRACTPFLFSFINKLFSCRMKFLIFSVDLNVPCIPFHSIYNKTVWDGILQLHQCKYDTLMNEHSSPKESVVPTSQNNKNRVGEKNGILLIIPRGTES